MAKLKLEQIEEILQLAGFTLVSGKYENLNSILEIQCEHGHIFPSTLKKVRGGKVKCPFCLAYGKTIEEEALMTSLPKKQGERLIAIDNATNTTGYAVFENGELLTYGVKHTSKSMSIEKIAEVKQWFVGLLKLWEIDYVGLENVQYQGNPQVLITLSKLLGVLENASYEQTGMAPNVVSAATWKSYCQIKGRNRAQQKENAQKHVKSKFDLVASQDACDAICLGLYAVDQVKLNTMVIF